MRPKSSTVKYVPNTMSKKFVQLGLVGVASKCTFKWEEMKNLKSLNLIKLANCIMLLAKAWTMCWRTTHVAHFWNATFHVSFVALFFFFFFLVGCTLNGLLGKALPSSFLREYCFSHPFNIIVLLRFCNYSFIISVNYIKRHIWI